MHLGRDGICCRELDLSVGLGILGWGYVWDSSQNRHLGVLIYRGTRVSLPSARCSLTAPG